MNLARNTLTVASTGLTIREAFQASGGMVTNQEVFVKFMKDGVEYCDIVAFALLADVTALITTGVTAGHYYTFTFTPGTTGNDTPAGSAVTLV